MRGKMRPIPLMSTMRARYHAFRRLLLAEERLSTRGTHDTGDETGGHKGR